MSSIGYSRSNLTDQEAEVIADAYFRADKDPAQMARIMETDHFDLNLLMHPLVKARIIAEKIKLNKMYSLEDHLDKLKEIRDGALGDENWKVALVAEVAVGKAAGLYEPKTLEDSNVGDGDAKKLTTAELRRRLTNATAALTGPEPEKESDPQAQLDELDESEREENF